MVFVDNFFFKKNFLYLNFGKILGNANKPIRFILLKLPISVGLVFNKLVIASLLIFFNFKTIGVFFTVDALTMFFNFFFLFLVF